MDVAALTEAVVYVLIGALFALAIAICVVFFHGDVIKPHIRSTVRMSRMAWFFLSGAVIGWVAGTFLAVLVYGEISNTFTQVKMIAYILWVLVVLLTLLYGITFIRCVLCRFCKDIKNKVKETTEGAGRYLCPVCGTVMKVGGQLPAGVYSDIYLDVCYCPRCGYRDFCEHLSMRIRNIKGVKS